MARHIRRRSRTGLPATKSVYGRRPAVTVSRSCPQSRNSMAWNPSVTSVTSCERGAIHRCRELRDDAAAWRAGDRIEIRLVHGPGVDAVLRALVAGERAVPV